MAEEEENIVFVVNCSKWLTSEELVKEIIGEEISPQRISEIISCYPWRIENKYYSACVKIFLLAKDQLGAHLDIKDNHCNAFVVLFDSTEKSFDLVKQWLPYIKLHNASVLLLVGSKCGGVVPKDLNETIQVLSRLQVVEWCIKHSFEFIDLNEEIDPEDDFPDTVGYARIVQALETTEWPSLKLKEFSNNLNDSPTHDVAGNSSLTMGNVLCSTDETNIPLNSNSSISNLKTTDDNPFMNELNTVAEMFDGITNSELNEDASFEQLFSQMKVIKEQAQNLPNSERKDYAEKVAVAFWHAIGGDEEEVEELDESRHC